jgi:hypothetical protein
MPTLAQANQVGWGTSSYYAPSGSSYWALNNDWNNPPNGTQSIDYNASTFPNGTTISWNYGSHIAPSNVWGYPEVIYGDQGGGGIHEGVKPANYGEQIGTLGHFNFSFDYSLTGNQNQYDVLAETHLSGNEVGVILNSPSYMTAFIKGFTQHHFDLGGISGEAVPGFWGPGSLMVIPDSVENGTPMTHGSIDLAPILQYAVSQGWLSSNEQVTGWELGVEAQQGAGSLTVNQFNVDWGPGDSTGGSTGGSTTTTTGGSSDTSSSGSSTGSSGSTTTTGGSSDTSSSGSSTDSGGSTATTGGSSDTSSSGSSTDSGGSTTTTGGSSDTSGSSTGSSGSTTTTGGSSTGSSSSGSGTWTHHSHSSHSHWSSSTGSSGSTTITGGSSTGTHSLSSHSPCTSSHSNTGASTAMAHASTAASTAMAHAFTAASLMDHHDWLIGTNFTHHSDWA